MLPDWLPQSLWDEWVADRKERRQKMTTRAEAMAIKKLIKYRDEGHDPKDVIEYSIEMGWRGLFPPPPRVKAAAEKTTNAWQFDNAALEAKAAAMGVMARSGESYQQLRARVSAQLQ